MSLYRRLHDADGGVPAPEIQAPNLSVLDTQWRTEFDVLPDRASGYVAVSCSKDVKDQVLASPDKDPHFSADERDRNQDDYFISNEHQLFVVADGMGGHHGGAEASKLVAHAFRKEYAPSVPDVASLDEAKDRLQTAVATARKDVALARESQRSNMGSTLIAAQIVDDKLVWANAGDSVLMVYRNSSLIRINKEQTVPGVGNILTNCIDSENGDADEYGVFDLELGDRIVLASDGVAGDEPNNMTDSELEALLASDNPSQAANDLTTKSHKVDDTTAIVIDYKPEEATKNPALPQRTLKTPSTAVVPSSPSTAPDYSHLPSPPDAIANPVTPEAPKTMAELQAELEEQRAAYAAAMVLHEAGLLSDKKWNIEKERYETICSDINALGLEELKDTHNISDPAVLDGLVEFAGDLENDVLVADIVDIARFRLVNQTVKRRKALAFGTHKKIDAAKAVYDKWRDIQGIRAATLIRAAGAEQGKTEAEMDDYLTSLITKVAVVDILNLQKDICDEAQNQSGARGKFVKWWGSQGGEKFMSVAGLKGNFKRGAVMMPIGAAVALPLGTLLGAGFATVAAVGITRSFVRSAATNKLNNSADEISAVKHAVNDTEVSSIEVNSAINNYGVVSSDVITDMINARTKLIVKGNRRSFAGSVALGAAAGTVGGFAADWLKDHVPFSGGGSGSANGSGTPPTTQAGGSGQGGGAAPIPPGSIEPTPTTTPNTPTTASTNTTTPTASTPDSTTPASGGNTHPSPSAPNAPTQILGPDGQPYTQAELGRIFNSQEFKNMVNAPVVEEINGQPVTSFDKYVQANNARVAEQIQEATSTPEGKAAWDNMVANPEDFKSMVDHGNAVNSLVNNPDAYTAFSNPNNYPNLVAGIETLHQNYPHFQGAQFDMLVQDALRLASIREQLLAEGKTEAEINDILKSLFGS